MNNLFAVAEVLKYLVLLLLVIYVFFFLHRRKNISIKASLYIETGSGEREQIKDVQNNKEAENRDKSFKTGDRGEKERINSDTEANRRAEGVISIQDGPYRAERERIEGEIDRFRSSGEVVEGKSSQIIGSRGEDDTKQNIERYRKTKGISEISFNF
jgi:uncharacterized protein YxeA